MASFLQALNQAVAALHARARQSLVQLRAADQSLGAGVIWSPDGYIVTSAHVVATPRRVGSPSFQVLLADGRQIPAHVEHVHPDHDVALLRVAATDLTPISTGDSRRLQTGEWVYALGFPWGVEGGATAGVVIGMGSDLSELGDGAHEWVAAALRLRPGHSGGPMLDSSGRLIGINTLMTGPQVGAAVPVHVVEEFVRTHIGHAQPLGPVVQV